MDRERSRCSVCVICERLAGDTDQLMCQLSEEAARQQNWVRYTFVQRSCGEDYLKEKARYEKQSKFCRTTDLERDIK